MALKLSTDSRNAILNAITSSVGNSGILVIYSGTRPANVATAPAGNAVLAELTLGAPMAPPASGGVLTLNSIQSDNSANASGTATWFRIFQSNGTTAVIDGEVGATGSTTADLILNTTSIVATGPVSITSFQITAPGA